MSNVWDLDSMREEIEQEFQPFQMTVAGQTIVLRNPIRMPKKERKALQEALEELNKMTTEVTAVQDQIEKSEKDETGETPMPEFDSVEFEERILAASKQVLRLAAGGKEGTLLVNALGDDLQLTQKLIQRWGEVVKPGEASSSEN